ncbi:hypothetical protein [Aestuariibaculum sediminum]|uniref:Outer membrane protein beta-barrel domain-containing protein n=1 Tax=Aestuariibaculum sediminum TaxID=2770637 RepID=A0A8J6U8H7_9FLAO|nr:hypothetical protein [Aestuariibaculum sediminum]MBD0831572.1 hypothetical protein [Aestuariibaculum sediminum]
MKYNLVTLFITSCSLFCIGQNDGVFFEINYNTFSHNSLKEFQQEFINDVSEVELTVNDNFPANIGFTLGYNFNYTNAAIFLSYNTTGGKISYSDYSGILRITQPLTAFTLGGEYLVHLSKTNNRFNLGLRGFGMFSLMKIESYTQILDDKRTENIRFNAINYGVGSRLIYSYPMSFFILKASIGFDLTFGGNLKFQENNDFQLENDRGEKVKTNWSGLRTGIGIEIPL